MPTYIFLTKLSPENLGCPCCGSRQAVGELFFQTAPPVPSD